jgi:hypothetical protein
MARCNGTVSQPGSEGRKSDIGQQGSGDTTNSTHMQSKTPTNHSQFSREGILERFAIARSSEGSTKQISCQSSSKVGDTTADINVEYDNRLLSRNIKAPFSENVVTPTLRAAQKQSTTTLLRGEVEGIQFSRTSPLISDTETPTTLISNILSRKLSTENLSLSKEATALDDTEGNVPSRTKSCRRLVRGLRGRKNSSISKASYESPESTSDSLTAEQLWRSRHAFNAPDTKQTPSSCRREKLLALVKKKGEKKARKGKNYTSYDMLEYDWEDSDNDTSHPDWIVPDDASISSVEVSRACRRLMQCIDANYKIE